MNCYDNEKNIINLEIFKKLSTKYNKTISQIALNLIAQNTDFDTVAIVGSNTLKILEESLNCFTDNTIDIKLNIKILIGVQSKGIISND